MNVPADVELTAAHVQAAQGALQEFHAESGAFFRRYGAKPLASSQFEKDLAAFARADPVHTVYGQAMTLIEIAADQLTAFLKVTTEPCETIAPWTCTRSLLEASALGAWLLGPGIPVKERVGRSFSLRYEGLEQQARFARAEGTLDPQLTLNRIDEVTRNAADLGFSPILDRKGRHIGIGQRMPSVTELIREVLQQESMYRLLSAVAHGHFWATHKAGFAVAAEGHTGAGGAALRHMTKAVNIPGIIYLAGGAARAFGRLAWYHCLYVGWPEDEMAKLLTHLFERLAIRQEYQFWLN